MARYIIPGFRKIETSGGGEGGTTNYNDLTNKPFINDVPLVGNLRTVNLKLTDATLTEEGVPAEAKTVGQKLEELNSKYAKKDLYDDTNINVGRKASTEIGSNSTAEGNSTTASGASSHAEGSETISAGYCSHAEGEGTNAGDDYAHVEGLNTYANYCSHAEGEGSTADSAHQHVEGKYNISDLSHEYAHIIGNGNSDRERSNAHTVSWEGNAWYAGDVTNGNNVSLNGLQKDIEELNSNLDNFFKKNCDNYINNIFNISYSAGNEYDTLNDNGVIATEDASVLVNSPVTSGAFYAYREVLFIKSPLNNNKIIVRLTEAYPEPGRIWLSAYNMDLSTWSNWRCI